jgi:putative glycosyltransferase
MEFYKSMTGSAKKIFEADYEFIIVNDGSPDQSIDLLKSVAENDKNLVLVDLTRNFGHHNAIKAGLAQATGDLVFLIDSDLEENPELLETFYKTLKAESLDSVYGTQIKRKGNRIERIGGALFYSTFNVLSKIKIPRNLSTVRLMTRRYVDALLLFNESEMFLGGIWAAVGYKQRGIEFQKTKRQGTSYSLGARSTLALKALPSFSSAPLIVIWAGGFGLSLLSLVYVLFLVVNWAFFANPPSGWTSLLASVWLIGSFLLLSIGVLAVYLATIFSEVKGRPNYLVREIIRSPRD